MPSGEVNVPRLLVRWLFAASFACAISGGSGAAEDLDTGALPENDAVKVLGAEAAPCEAEPGTGCLRVRVECKLKRRVSNWSKSLVRIVWLDAGGAPGYSASKGYDSCRNEVGERFDLWFPLPPPGFTYAIELP